MNHSRRRNVFTLANFENAMSMQQRIKNQMSRRRQNSDPFERDPFKIQSYNFHYAERPVYPVQNAQRTTLSPTAASAATKEFNNKQFDTFYYNHDFPNSTKASSMSVANNKENKSNKSNKSLEVRRRKFLREQQTSTSNLNPINRFLPSATTAMETSAVNQSVEHADWCTTFNNPDRHNGFNTEAAENIYYTVSRHESLEAVPKKILNSPASTRSSIIKSTEVERKPNVKPMRKSNSDSPVNRTTQTSKTQTAGNSITDLLSKRHQSHDGFPAFSLNRFDQIVDSDQNVIDVCNINRRQNDFSGCEININIKGMDDDTINENVIIKIDSDPIQRNLDINRQSSKYLKSVANLGNSSAGLNVNRPESTQTFYIDKRLSKFEVDMRDLSQERRRNGKRNSSLDRGRSQERPNERNQIKRSMTSYSMRSSTNAETNTALKPFKLRNGLTSTERLPSLVPWSNSNNLNSSSSSSRNRNSNNKFQNLNRGNSAVSPSPYASNHRKNLLQKTQDNLNCSNRSRSTGSSKKTEPLSRTQGTSSNQRNFFRPEVKLHGSNSSRLSLKSTDDLSIEGSMIPIISKGSTTRLLGSRSSYERLTNVMSRTNSKLPVNVNINVYTSQAGNIRV